MTGRQLIEYIQKWGLEDCPVEVQYRDEFGYLYGTDTDIETTIIEPGKYVKYAGCVNYKRLVL